MLHRFRNLVLALVMAFPASALSQAPGNVCCVLTRLSLDLRVDYDSRTVSGTATMTVRNASDRAAAAIPLLLNRLMTVQRIVGKGGTDLGFMQDVVVFRDDPARQVTSIVVRLVKPIVPGDSMTMVAHYGGILTGYTETGSLYIRDRVSRDFTIIREDAYAFPVLGVNSMGAMRAAPRGPFTFSARVTLPAGYVVAMGGSRGELVTRDSLATWTYHSTAPVPFLNITVAPYRVLERAGVRVFHFPADSSGASMIGTAVTGALSFLTNRYGSLGAVPDLAVMEIPEGFGSQASLSAGVILTADTFSDRAQLRQLYHELSHLWNVEDADKPSPRWNEGLATFLQWRMAAELDGWSDWDARLTATAQSLIRRCTPQTACDSVPFADYGTAGHTDLSYQVGFLMFYLLHEVLGAEGFDRTYREFFQRYRAREATTVDLASAFREADPRCERILSDWLFTTRWHARLSAGETVKQMVDGYRVR